MSSRARTRFVRMIVGAAAAAALAIGVVELAPTESHVASASTPSASTPSTASTACTAGTLVHTTDGPVCGATADGVTSYRGIDFAAPPIGRLRWQPPQPVTRWTKTFPATVEGNGCPQPTTLGLPASGSEDCLNLDVQIPADTSGTSRLPVMVEIHGGGYIIGEAKPDGSNLVTNGHVIYVTFNYRLGILGFMAHKGLGPHSGDYGLQDQQAALRWVQRNIARFGGDPHNVTIFGESAGGASVCAQAVSPTARGLFQRGIAESGFYNYNKDTVVAASDCKTQLATEAQAQRAGAAFAAKVGCGTAANQIACLRTLPASTLLANAGQVFQPDAGGTVAPIINGTTLTMSPAKAFATGHVNKVGLMIGVDRDEFNGGANIPSNIAATPAQYRALVRQQFGPLADTVMRLYPLSRFPAPSPFIAYRTIMADSAAVCPALASYRRLTARHVQVYAWEGDNADVPASAGSTWPTGSSHITEAKFLFPSSTANWDPNQKAYQEQITAEWTGYARTGNPTVTGTPNWTNYTQRNPFVMSLMPAGDSALTPASTIAIQHHCGFWDAVSWPVPQR